MKRSVIVGDIGGTNSTLALIVVSGKTFEINQVKKYRTIDHKDFAEIINDFYSLCMKSGHNVGEGVFAVAGRVDDNRVEMSNTSLVLDIKILSKKTHLKKIELINDFTAIAYSIESLPRKSLEVINQGSKHQYDSVKAIIGAGTGLGKAFLVKNGEKTDVMKSEGGHEDFAPCDDKEAKLEEFIKKKHNVEMVEWEDVLSGRGIESIYEFLTNNELTSAEISSRKKTDKYARLAFEMFYKFFARAAKNFALEVLSEGGMYLAGGIIEKNLDFDKTKFMKEFTKNERYSKYLSEIPIYAIIDYGASIYGLGNYIVNHK